jgi:hypothetical protein
MLHKDYDLKGSAEKKNLCCESQRDWRRDKLISGKQPVVQKL